MEETFNKLKKEGKNTVGDLIKWMQESKLVEKTKAAEEKARKYFAGAENSAKVDFKKFEEALAKLAAEKKKSVKELTDNLEAEGSKFVEAAKAAAKAAATTFHNAIKK